MNFLIGHFDIIIGLFLILSECAAAIVQLIYPDNKGVAGVLAGIIKSLQALKNKEK